MSNPDWIMSKELDETTGEMIEVLTPRPGSKAEQFTKMLDDIRNLPKRPRPSRK